MDIKAKGGIEVFKPLGVKVAVGNELRARLGDESGQHGKIVSHVHSKWRRHIVDAASC